MVLIMICLKCNAFHSGFSGRLCPVCSEPLAPESSENEEKLILGRIQYYISKWKTRGLLSSSTVQEIENALISESPHIHKKNQSTPENIYPVFQTWFQNLVTSFFVGLSSIVEPILVQPTVGVKKHRLKSKSENEFSIFSGEDDRLSGLESITDLDNNFKHKNRKSIHDPDADLIWSGLKPLFNEYIWWFIGTLLVLTGSVMGIREAWMNLQGLSKSFVMLGALFLYQVFFVSLGIFFSKRSPATGRMLSGISILLLPILFAVESDILILDNLAGAITLIILTIMSSGLLILISKQFQAKPLKIILSILPSVILQSLIPMSGRGMISIAFLFIPLALIEFLIKSSNFPKEKESKYFLMLSLYGAFSIIAVYLNQDAAPGFELIAGSLVTAILLLWALFLSSIIALAFKDFRDTLEYSKIYAVIEIICLSITLAIASFGGIYIYNANPFDRTIFNIYTRLVYVCLPIFASVVFLSIIPKYRTSIQPFMALSIISSFLLFREISPSSNWNLAMSTIIPVGGILFYKKQNLYLQKNLFFWGVISGSLTCLILIFYIDSMAGFSLPLFAFGLLFGFVSHRTGGFSRTILHSIGALGIFTALESFSFLFPVNSIYSRTGIIFGLLSFIYSLAAIFIEKKLGEKSDNSSFQPLDDIALLSGILSLICILFASNVNSIQEYSSGIAISIILILRSFRDKSKFVSFLGLFLFSVTSYRIGFFYYSFSSLSQNAYLSGIIAFIACVSALLFPEPDSANEPEPLPNRAESHLQGSNMPSKPTGSRKVFFVIRLPFPADNYLLIKDALTALSGIYILYTIALISFWIFTPFQIERNPVIISGILLCLLFIISFFTKSLSFFNLKGSVVALALFFFAAGLTAVVNRIGRPLPPPVVGTNLTLGIIALWVFSRVLYYKGNLISAWLDRPSHGKYFHYIPLYSMLIIGAVLFIDVLFVGTPTLSRFLYITPPTFFIGISIALLLYGISENRILSINLAFGFCLISMALIFAQGNPGGIEMAPLDPPGGRWVPLSTISAARTGNWLNPSVFLPESITPGILILRSTIGLAFSSLIFSLLSIITPLFNYKNIFQKDELLKLQILFSIWSLISVFILAVISFNYAFIYAGVIALASGFILLFSNESRRSAVTCIALSIILIIHGFAHVTPLYPMYAGPLFAGLGFLMVLGVKPLSSRIETSYGRALETLHMGALIFSFIGFIYSLAVGSPSIADSAVPGLLNGALQGMSGQWMLTIAPGLTLAISALSLIYGSAQWTKFLSTFGALSGVLLFSLSGIISFPYAYIYLLKLNQGFSVSNLPGMLPYFGLIASVVAAISYFSSEYIAEQRKDLRDGYSYASDILIIVTGLFLGIFIRLGINSILVYSNIIIILTISIIILVTLFASFKTLKPRHLYFLQTAIVSLYLGMKPAFGNSITSETDATIALIFGFILTGITTVAHRIGIPPLAETTRRFAAFMPVLAIIVLPTQATYQNAGIATFSAVLYAFLGIATSSRLFAVLAAIAANLAIFTAVIASNAQGIEIYLAPIGLFSLFLGHIFKENLTDAAKKSIRLAGGLLLYLPAAVNISFEMGMATDAFYAVIFGIICLLGIAVGMLFQIRSYLFMGVTFFTLNIVANLLQKGLRNPLMGFILLSLAGLSIIGILIFYSMKKEVILGYANKLKRILSSWD